MAHSAFIRPASGCAVSATAASVPAPVFKSPTSLVSPSQSCHIAGKSALYFVTEPIKKQKPNYVRVRSDHFSRGPPRPGCQVPLHLSKLPRSPSCSCRHRHHTHAFRCISVPLFQGQHDFGNHINFNRQLPQLMSIRSDSCALQLGRRGDNKSRVQSEAVNPQRTYCNIGLTHAR